MGWFDEQIKLRQEKDDEVFFEALEEISAAIEGRPSKIFVGKEAHAGHAMQEILEYYRFKCDELPENITDFNEQLEYLCRPHGLMHRVVELTGEWYKDAAGPMLAKKKEGGFIALIPGKISGYSFLDSETGKRVELSKKTAGLIEKEAICFYKPFPQKKLTIPHLIRYIWESIPFSSRLMVLVFTMVATFINMLLPKITNIIFTDVLMSGSVRLLVAAAVLFVSISISTILFTLLKTLVVRHIELHLSMGIQAASMARILSLPPSFFKEHSSGDLSQRMAYLNSLCSMLVNAIFGTGFTTLFSLLYITQIFIYARELVTPSLLLILISFAFAVVSSILKMKQSLNKMKIEAKLNGMTFSMLSGIEKIKLSGSEKRMFSRWLRLYTKESMYTFNAPIFFTINSVIANAITLIGTVVMYYYAVRSGISVADFYSFATAYGMVSSAFAALAGMSLTIATIKPTLEMARPILETTPETSEKRKFVTSLNGAIELNNISFRYKENLPPVLDDISLRIRPGQYVAIVGKTGCGKSTLMRILLGFETPQKGAVYYDGRDLKTLDLRSLRQHIGTVTQDGKLFMGDLFSNIAICKPQMTLDEAWEAAELAAVADDIRRMPMGMHTIISEGAGGISGGQRQRILIARAIAPKPSILFFDEATSALDNLTQKHITESLDKLKCTRIIIAHRLSTIKQCDRIIVLDNGKIIDDGKYDELMERNEFFKDLVKRQTLE